MQLFKKNKRMSPVIQIPVKTVTDPYIYNLKELYGEHFEGKSDIENARLDDSASRHDLAIVQLAQQCLQPKDKDFFIIIHEIYISQSQKNKKSFSGLITTLLCHHDFTQLLNQYKTQILALYLYKYYEKLGVSQKKQVKNIVFSCEKVFKDVYDAIKDIEKTLAEEVLSTPSTPVGYVHKPCFKKAAKAILNNLPVPLREELSTANNMIEVSTRLQKGSLPRA